VSIDTRGKKGERRESRNGKGMRGKEEITWMEKERDSGEKME
jgi:hypothetical protein